MSRSSVSDEDYRALAAFRYAMRKFLRFSKTTLAAMKLTPEQYEALLALKAFPDTGLSIGQLSERLQVKHHSTVSLVAKLYARKLISREKRADDRRHVYIRLAAEGEQLLGEAAALHRDEIRVRSPEMIEPLLRLRE